MRRGNAGEWPAVTGKPERDRGGPCVQPTTTSPFFSTSHRKVKLGSRILGLETPPTCRNPAKHPKSDLPYKLRVEFDPSHAQKPQFQELGFGPTESFELGFGLRY